MPRFSKADQLELNRARALLKDDTATPEAKLAAERAIARIQTERKRRIAARKSAGVEPQRKNFETEEQYKTAIQEYWARLDRAVAEREAWKILNDPTSSTLVRTRAYERLGIEPPETLRRDEVVSDPPQEASKKVGTHSFSDAELAEERRREKNFYDTLAAIRLAEKEKEHTNE
jgi:hypothetical protein